VTSSSFSISVTVIMAQPSPQKRPAEGTIDVEPELKKAKTTLQDHLQPNWKELCKPLPGTTNIAWLRQRKAWWQFRTNNAKGRVHLDMAQFVDTTPAKTVAELIQRNELLPWAFIGDLVQCPLDKHGKIVLDKHGNPSMYTPYSFARQTFQDVVLASYVLDEEQMRYCSMTAPGCETHAYFDLDCSADQKGFAAVNGKLHEVLTLMLLFLNECFEAVVGRPFNASIKQFGPACTATKFSCHLHFPAEVFENADHLRAFRNALVLLIKEKHSDSLLGQVDIDTFIDGSVYNKYANLKMLGSRKPGRDNIQLYDYDTRTYTKLIDMKLGKRFNVLFNEQPSYAICNPDGQDFVAWPDVVAKKAKIQQRIAAGERIMPSGLKTEYFGIKTEDIQKVAEDNQFELVEERISEPHCVQFKTHNLTHPRECNVGGVETVHNTWWVGCSVSKWGVYMRCPGAGCVGHKKLLLRSPMVKGKEAAISEVVDAIDTTQVVSWEDTVKAMIQADVPKEQIIEVTAETGGAELVEEGWRCFAAMPELKRNAKPLLAIVKKQGVVSKMQLDAWKTRILAATEPVAGAAAVDDAPVHDLARLKATGDSMPYPLTTGQVLSCLVALKTGSTSALAEAFHKATKNDIVLDAKSAGVVWWDDTARLWLRRKPSVMKAILKAVLLPLIDLMPDNDRRKLAFKYVEEAGKYGAIIDLVMSHMTAANQKPKKFNRIKHLYPLRGGYVLDFKTRERRLRTRDDLFTFETRVDFLGADADLARAKKFTDEIMCDDSSMTKYLQRRLGYMLCGETGLRAMDIWTGSGTNGKTVLEKIMARLMEASDDSPGFFCKLGSDYFILKKKSKGAATTESNGLHEARGGFSSEPSEGVIDAEGIKAGVGGEKKVLRANYGEETPVELQAKYVLILNSMIEVSPKVKAFWNKISIIPFLAQFEETDATMAYCEALVNDQVANDQMFTWIALGMFDNYNAAGTITKPETPDLVKEQKTLYRKEANTFEKFVAEQLCVLEKPSQIDKTHPFYTNYILKAPRKTDKKASINMIDLYHSWCSDHDIPSDKRMHLAEISDMANRMFESCQLTQGQDRGQRPYIGVRVKLPQDNAKEMMVEFINLVALEENSEAKGDIEGYHDKVITPATLFRAYQRFCQGVKGFDVRVKKQLSMEACVKVFDRTFEKRHANYIGVQLPAWLDVLR
jgi:putative DNA primase/helicase